MSHPVIEQVFTCTGNVVNAVTLAPDVDMAGKTDDINTVVVNTASIPSAFFAVNRKYKIRIQQ